MSEGRRTITVMAEPETPNWAAIEQDIECALVAEQTEIDLLVTEVFRKVGCITEEWRILRLNADGAARAIDGFAAAWNSGPAWN